MSLVRPWEDTQREDSVRVVLGSQLSYTLVTFSLTSISPRTCLDAEKTLLLPLLPSSSSY